MVPEDFYNKLVDKKDMTLAKMMRLVFFGLLKHLKHWKKEDLRSIHNISGEIFSQICLTAQQLKPIDKGKYAKSQLVQLENGLLTVSIRKRYDEELYKLTPIVEDNRLLKLIINHLHKSQFGNIKIGRVLHRSTAKSIKLNYNTQFGIYRNRLAHIFGMVIKGCWICSLSYPREVESQLGTRVAGAVKDQPYSHISVDDVTMGAVRGYPTSKFCIQNRVLVVSCLLTGHISLEPIQNCSSISIALALRRIEMRHGIRILSIWSDNFTALRETSLGEHVERGFQVAMENLEKQQTDVRFHTNLSYSKARNYVERSVRSIREAL